MSVPAEDSTAVFEDHVDSPLAVLEADRLRARGKALRDRIPVSELAHHEHRPAEVGVRAVMDGNIVGLVVTTSEYQLVTWAKKDGERHWAPLTAGRIVTHGQFPEEMHVSLSPQRIAATTDTAPQIVFLPDGEISRFTLSLQSFDKKQRFSVVSQGASPVSVENDD